MNPAQTRRYYSTGDVLESNPDDQLLSIGSTRATGYASSP
jgi:ATP-dependent protease HslVU (ClpYQ) peptidase subunit